MDCCRCLRAYPQKVQVQFEEMYYPQFDVVTRQPLRLEQELEEEFIIKNIDRLDLTDVVRQHVILGMPPFPVCQVECRGLCQVCGANQNDMTCTCSVDDTDPRLLPFRHLLEQMREGNSASKPARPLPPQAR